MAYFLPNGLGGFVVGDSLAQASRLLVSGNVWYVDTVDGTDAVSPRGLNASAPLLTLSQALTNAANHDIIVLLNSDGEGLTTALTISKSVTIIGSGTSSGLPANALYRIGGAAANLLTITAADVQLRNLLFEETGYGETSPTAVATARIVVTGARFRMVGCVVKSGAADTGPALSLGSGADGAELRSCTFISTSTTTAPESAIKNSAAIAGLRIFNTTISGGATGWSNFYGVDLSAAAVTRAEIEGMSLLLGSDMKLNASSAGWVHVATSTGSSRVDW